MCLDATEAPSSAGEKFRQPLAISIHPSVRSCASRSPVQRCAARGRRAHWRPSESPGRFPVHGDRDRHIRESVPARERPRGAGSDPPMRLHRQMSSIHRRRPSRESLLPCQFESFALDRRSGRSCRRPSQVSRPHCAE